MPGKRWASSLQKNQDDVLIFLFGIKNSCFLGMAYLCAYDQHANQLNLEL